MLATPTPALLSLYCSYLQVFDGGLILQLSDTLASMSKAPGVETKVRREFLRIVQTALQ